MLALCWTSSECSRKAPDLDVQLSTTAIDRSDFFLRFSNHLGDFVKEMSRVLCLTFFTKAKRNYTKKDNHSLIMFHRHTDLTCMSMYSHVTLSQTYHTYTIITIWFIIMFNEYVLEYFSHIFIIIMFHLQL